MVLERTSEALQACLERAPQAKQYYSDAFPVYDTLYYGAPYEMRTEKQESYSVETVNADLRHDLKRLLANPDVSRAPCNLSLETFDSLSMTTIKDN